MPRMLVKVMEEIDRNELRAIVSCYKPEFQYLLHAQEEFPVAHGLFQFGKTAYAERSVDYVSVVEAMLAFNQLSYVATWQWMKEGRLGKRVAIDEYLQRVHEGMLIREIEHMKFGKRIAKGRSLEGSIQVADGPRAIRGTPLQVATLDFRLDDRKLRARVKIAVVQ